MATLAFGVLVGCGSDKLDFAALPKQNLWVEVLSTDRPQAFAPVHDDGLIGEWTDGLAHRDARGGRTLLDGTGLALVSAASLPTGEWLVATPDDLRVWVDGVLVRSALTEAIGAPVQEMLVEGGRLWLHTGDQLFLVEDDALVEVRVAGAKLTGPFAVDPTRGGQAWVATDQGIVAVDSQRVHVQETLPDVNVQSIAADCTGQVWATDGERLWERNGPDDWTEYRPSEQVTAVRAHPDGEGVWIHTRGPVVIATSEGLTAGNRTIPGTARVDTLGRLLVPDDAGLLRYGTGPALAIAGLADESVLSGSSEVVLAPSTIGALSELSALVDGVAVPVDIATGTFTLDATSLDPDQPHTFGATAQWEDGATATARTLRFTIDRAGTVTWEDDIWPIYANQCAICHGGSAETQLDTPEAWSSRIDTLLDLVTRGAMPIGGTPLTGSQIAAIEAWREADFP